MNDLKRGAMLRIAGLFVIMLLGTGAAYVHEDGKRAEMRETEGLVEGWYPGDDGGGGHIEVTLDDGSRVQADVNRHDRYDYQARVGTRVPLLVDPAGRGCLPGWNYTHLWTGMGLAGCGLVLAAGVMVSVRLARAG